MPWVLPLPAWILRSGWPVLGVLVLGSLGERHAARPAQQTDAKALYTKLCAACHGPAGKGNGPAAVAFKPRPASFTDPAFQATRSDSQLTASITSGKAAMPGFGQQLSRAEIRALVAYVRALGPGAEKP